MKTLSYILLPTYLPNLYIMKISNLFTTCVNYGFSVRNNSFPNKIDILYKNKKTVDLKLQHRISRNNSFSRYLSSPETY